jgi:hypothetical protein
MPMQRIGGGGGSDRRNSKKITLKMSLEFEEKRMVCWSFRASRSELLSDS